MEKELLNASRRWKEEGKQYKDKLNDWLDIYLRDEQPTTECPQETREDMVNYVFSKICEFNGEKKYEQLRELFPPDSDPFRPTFDNKELWDQVRKVAYLSDGRILAKVGDYYETQGVYIVDGNNIQLAEGVIGFGFNHDKKYFAKVYETKIIIHEGWDGKIVCELKIPDGMSVFDIKYENILVFPDGKRVVLVTYYGIFYIDENSYKLFHGDSNGGEQQQEISGNEPEHPSTVPAEARWNADENEWEVGENNSEGNPIGEWKWWLAPKGYLCCHTFFKGKEGNVMSFTRYHEDGTPSRIGTYIDGQPFGDLIWIRSENPTIEQYPTNAGANVWKTVSTVKNGYTVEEHYFDKEGNEIQEPYISNVEASELIKRMAVLDRFYIDKDWKRLLAGAEKILDDDLAEDDDLDQMKVIFYKAISLYEMNGKEADEDIEELAEKINDLRTFEIWDFLPQFAIAKEAVKFAKMILDEDENDDEEDEEDEDTQKYNFISYPHAALSPDGKYVVVGSQMSNHIILKEEDSIWNKIDEINPVSEYPNAALFNYKMQEPIVALSSCHMYQSGTCGATVKSFGNPDAAFSESEIWNMDEEDMFVINENRWVFSLLDIKTGFWLGTNDGYIWHKNLNTGKLQYVYIGGTPLSIDISEDGKYMAIGTHAGQLNILKLEYIENVEDKNPRIDPYLITNTSFTDEKRYLFFKQYDPMIW